MRPNIMRRLVFGSVAFWALWLIAPSRVLAVGNSVDDMFQKSTNGGNTPTVPAVTGDGSVWGSMIQLIFALGLIIAIIYLLIRFLSSRSKIAQAGGMQTVGAHALTSNRSVHMILSGDKIYVLGVGENVSLLDTISDPELVAQYKAMSQTNTAAPMNNLQELFKRLRPKPKAQSEEIQLNDLSFDATLREKIQTLKQKRDGHDVLQEGRDE